MFDTDKLSRIFPKTSRDILESYIGPLNGTVERFDLNTVDRAASFIAQVGHESGYLTRITENLNYSKAGLLKTFKKYFNDATATQYARKPEKIANRVYANRMGNGNESSGDGWRFRGRGLIQVTGRNNYTRLAQFLDMPLEEVLKYLETHEGATVSAGWFWDENNLNQFADAKDIRTLTRRINGGLNGLEDRIDLWERALDIL